MKACLAKLLFEEYKQTRLFLELESKGIDLLGVVVHNLEIVCDLIGFPADTYRNVSYNPDTQRIEETFNEDGYDREFIYIKFEAIYDAITKKQNIEVTDKGLRMTEHEDEKLVMKKITEFVDWLYAEWNLYTQSQ